MKRYMLTVAYEGTAYSGFQIQPSCPTIEGELNKHLSALFAQDIKVIGGSRTDAGVHALCNVAVFDAVSTIPGEKIAYAINQRLPEDIRVQGSKEVPADFHPRHRDTRKTYEYRIALGEFPNPLLRNFAHFTYHKVDVEKMKEAATYLVGEHDFKSFCAAATVVEDTVRTIYSVDVDWVDSEIRIRVCGNGFLYNMVRIIAGTLLEVGKGRFHPEEIMTMLEAKDRRAAGPTASACGLTLVKYEFL